MEARASASTPEPTQAYSGATIAAAAIATLVFPVISLIVALVLLGNETDPAKRSTLRTWALAAGAWLALQAVIFAIGFAAFAAGGGGDLGQVDRSGPCVGGPEIGASGTDISGNGTKFRVPCAISGTTIVDFPDR